MKITIKKTILILASVLTMNAYAGNLEKPLNVSSIINKTCTVSMSNIAFGVYSPDVGDSFANTDIISKCTKGTAYSIGNNDGLSPDGIANKTIKYGVADG